MIKKGFKILEYKDVRDDLLKYREKGALRGVYLGFPSFHEHYTMSLPGATEWTGFPQSGKSEFLLEMLLNTSLFYGWKHLLYVPDVGDKNEILSLLIHKITGKTFDKRFVNSNYISESEVEKELNWVLEHFFILNKDDLKVSLTPYEFWDMAVVLKKEKGIHTATIDSWKDLRHGVGMNGETFPRDDKYLEDVLSYRNAISEKYLLHLHIIAHPNRTEKDSSGKRVPPTPFDMKGGQEWFNNGKNMITVHRVDGSSNEVRIIINKAKPKSVAALGEVRFRLDVSKNKYYTDGPDGPLYADPIYKKPKALEIAEKDLPKTFTQGSLLDDDEDDDMPF